MPSTLGALRRRLLTPDTSETKLSVRGFHEKTPESRDLLETVGRSFLEGYAFAAEAGTTEEAEWQLEQIPRAWRGFAYEGAGMGFAVRDALPFGRGGRTVRFLGGRARDHSYMVYVGTGWAMARVPRFRWPKVELGDPLLRWLALDGYGFHQAYFHTDKYIYQQYVEKNFPWPSHGATWCVDKVIDQGIGRATWFIGGTDPTVVANIFDSFPESRRADLYAGAGLAATYAGGGDADELREFQRRAGEYLPNLAQGSAFAASARVEAGTTVEHTGVATRILCDMTPEEATRLCADVRPAALVEVPEHPGIPTYELWRRRVTAVFAADAEVPA